MWEPSAGEGVEDFFEGVGDGGALFIKNSGVAAGDSEAATPGASANFLQAMPLAMAQLIPVWLAL